MRLDLDLAWPLRIERLLLRPFAPDDVEAQLSLHADPVAVRYEMMPDRGRG